MASFLGICASVLLLLIVAPSPAHAYLDPGTGSMAIQLLVAGALGAIFTLKTYWRSTKSYISGFFKKTGSEQK